MIDASELTPEEREKLTQLIESGYESFTESEVVLMSKGKWDLSSMYIGDKEIFRVYRLLDTSQPDHSGNREYSGDFFDSEEAAQSAADKLNKKSRC